MYHSKDARGVERGFCSQPGCTCPSYKMGSDGMKCSSCQHPPGKHHNLSNPMPVMLGPTANASSFQFHPTVTPYHSVSVSAGQGYSVPNWSGIKPAAVHVPQSYARTGESSSAGVEGYYHAHSPTQPTPQSGLNMCRADGCVNPCHYEQGLGWFDYCSPSCRDRHLLPLEKMRLQDDIKKFSDNLIKSSVALSQRTQSVSPVQQRLGPHGTATPRPKVTSDEVPSVTINKSPGKETGIILKQELYTSGRVKGYLVTGVQSGTIAYRYVERGELRLLDVIVEVDHQKASIHGKPTIFLEKLKGSKSACMTLDRGISLPCPKGFLEEAKIHCATYILALRNVGSSESGFGLTVRKSGNYVTGLSQNTPARESGLQFNDEIVCCAFVTKEKLETQLCLFNQDISKAAEQGQSVIVAVKRRDSRETLF